MTLCGRVGPKLLLLEDIGPIKEAIRPRMTMYVFFLLNIPVNEAYFQVSAQF
jgi:hypothetical protein